ncbi:acyltransferase family protein [Leifsonia sp. YIM 134122]|uniref:Acyltransferase family protein n=1 Tax=Leifsonia stereocauli TaxID=3134136 RepID=A0ABU9W5W9_9MICO
MTETATQPAVARPDPTPHATILRPEIQALRALAVASVLLYHLWPLRLPGGYIGVDIFFVISGFLITSHLLAEVARTGSVGVGAFWARRAKRLLPASLLVLSTVAVATVILVPRSLWNQFLGEVAASTLYVENWALAANSVDYLASSNLPSPVQHFWTLSAEEQFYILLPLVIIGAVALARWRRWEARRTLLVAVAACVAASFVYSLWATSAISSIAYFSTFTRAWEFGAGALLAFTSVQLGRRIGSTAAIIALASIVAASFLFSGSTAFPGWAAMLPVLATVAVIAAGSGTFMGTLGRFAPVAFLGRVSYGAYLWHWPLLVLLPFATGHALTTIEKVALLIAALVLAWGSTRFIEDPVRFSPRLLGRRRPRSVAIVLGVAMVVVLALSAVPRIKNAIDVENYDVAASATGSECFGARSMDPARDCSGVPAPTRLTPDPANVAADDSNRPECWARLGDAQLHVCTLGPERGYDRHLFAVGDSHNNTLIAAYAEIAKSHNWRIDVAGKSGCYWTTREQATKDFDIEPCRTWRAAVSQRINETADLDGVITTHSATTNAPVLADGESIEDATVEGLTEAWAPVSARGLPIIAIRDNPRATREGNLCVEQESASGATGCVTDRASALAAFDGNAEAAARTPGASVVDMTDFYCTATECPMAIGGVIVYLDPEHITATYARTLAPYLGERIAAALG